MFDASLYDDAFFKWHFDHVHERMVGVGMVIADYFKPVTLADIGCGIGSLLAGAKINGAAVLGIELSAAARPYTPDFVVEDIRYQDCTQPMGIGPYDCVVCTEVAEHIDPSLSTALVDNLCNSTDTRVVFSAAPPGQGGCGHINCQPPEFWDELFLMSGFSRLTKTDFLARLEPIAPDYIYRNIVVYENTSETS